MNVLHGAAERPQHAVSKYAVWCALTFFVATLVFRFSQFSYQHLLSRAASDRVLVHDFGTAYSGQTRQHVFRVANRWDKPVVVRHVVAECGCTTLDNDLVGKTIAVGQELAVPVKLLVPFTEGEFRKRAFVHFSEDDPRPLLLEMRARIRQIVSYSAPRVEITARSTSDVRSQTFTVAHVLGAPPFKLARVSTSTPTLRAEFEALTDSEAMEADTWRVKVTTVPPLAEVRTGGNVFLHAIDPEAQPLVVRAVVAVEPSAASDQVGE